MRQPDSKQGFIEAICGGMFSGKTEELIRRIRRAQIAKQKVAIFKPEIDNRYSADHFFSDFIRNFLQIIFRKLPYVRWKIYII